MENMKEKCKKILDDKICPNLTDCIFFYLQNDREFMDEYLSMSRAEQEDFNRKMGAEIKDRFELSNVGKCPNPRCTLIKSYTEHE